MVENEITFRDLMDLLEKNLIRMIEANNRELEREHAENAKKIDTAFKRIDQYKDLYTEMLQTVASLKTTMTERDNSLEKSLEAKIFSQRERLTSGETKFTTLLSLVTPIIYLIVGALISLAFRKFWP